MICRAPSPRRSGYRSHIVQPAIDISIDVSHLKPSIAIPKPTTKAIAISCEAATIESRPDSIFQPDSRTALPPNRIVMYATMQASSMTIEKFMKKPAVRHFAQNERLSPWQSSYCGNGVHLPVMLLHRLCSPYVTRMGSCSVGEV